MALGRERVRRAGIALSMLERYYPGPRRPRRARAFPGIPVGKERGERMKITDVETFVVGTDWRNLTIVRLHTDEGLTGLGEARMVNHTDALVGYLAEAGPRHVVGHDPFRIEDLVKKMGRDDFSRAGESDELGHRRLRDGLLGHSRQGPGPTGLQPPRRAGAREGQGLRQRLVPRRAHPRGVPRRRQEGGRTRIQSPEARPLRARTLRAGAGAKLRAVALVEAVRDAIGPEPEILLEMHGRFSPATAIEMAKMMEPFGLGWVEEPVPPVNLKALKKAAEGIPGGIPSRRASASTSASSTARSSSCRPPTSYSRT